MKYDRNSTQERLEQARKVREAIEKRVEAAEVRLRRLEAERELILRRIERQGGGSEG